MVIAILAVALLIASLPYSPPNLAGCSLAHGFVIGEAPRFSGMVEIWDCYGRTLVTLNQIRDLPAGSEPVTRYHFIPSPGPGERLMGCRGNEETFDGTVAIAKSDGGNRPELRRAWKADTGKWQFVAGAPTDLVCNRGLTVN
jgi:hypothetical protein